MYLRDGLWLSTFMYFHKCSSILPYLRHLLHKYANEDVSLGSWFIGLDVEHIDDRRLCCGTPPGNVFPQFFLTTCENNELVHGRQLSVRSNLVPY